MADSRVLTKRYFKLVPNRYGATYIKRTISYEPEHRSFWSNELYEGGYYLTISASKVELSQNDGVRSEMSDPFNIEGGPQCNSLKLLIEPATRFNAKKADALVEQYKDISYVQHFCAENGLMLADSDPDDKKINSQGFNYGYKRGGMYMYRNLDTKKVQKPKAKGKCASKCTKPMVKSIPKKIKSGKVKPQKKNMRD